jgi:hypothetical protein
MHFSSVSTKGYLDTVQVLTKGCLDTVQAIVKGYLNTVQMIIQGCLVQLIIQNNVSIAILNKEREKKIMWQSPHLW